MKNKESVYDRREDVGGRLDWELPGKIKNGCERVLGRGVTHLLTDIDTFFITVSKSKMERERKICLAQSERHPITV